MGDAARQFKIKHGVAKRTLKELQSYDKEIAQQKDKVEKMTAEGVEPTDIRQQTMVLQEAEACKVDARRRLDGALQDLEEQVDIAGEELKDTPELVEALALLKEHPPPQN